MTKSFKHRWTQKTLGKWWRERQPHPREKSLFRLCVGIYVNVIVVVVDVVDVVVVEVVVIVVDVVVVVDVVNVVIVVVDSVVWSLWSLLSLSSLSTLKPKTLSKFFEAKAGWFIDLKEDTPISNFRDSKDERKNLLGSKMVKIRSKFSPNFFSSLYRKIKRVDKNLKIFFLTLETQLKKNQRCFSIEIVLTRGWLSSHFAVLLAAPLFEDLFLVLSSLSHSFHLLLALYLVLSLFSSLLFLSKSIYSCSLAFFLLFLFLSFFQSRSKVFITFLFLFIV